MIGLYYPYIHFRDENWLKLALVYWSKLARIVPDQYQTHDSDGVKRVKDELDAVISAHPMSGGTAVIKEFISLVQMHAKQLRKKYDVSNASSWKPDAYTATHAPAGACPDPRKCPSSMI